MFISREYDYALRIVRVLANYEKFTVAQICTREHIPQPFAYKILKKLEKVSIIQGHRGAHGGYQLITPLQSLTLYSIYIAVEGSLCISDCMQDGYKCPNNEKGVRCAVHRELYQIQKQLTQSMNHRNLAEIFEDCR